MTEANTIDPSSLKIEAENLPPHSIGKQITGIVIASIIILAIGGIGGMIVVLAGIFTFLDSWYSGIYKKPDTNSFTNISPMSWGIVMMGLIIVAYPVYLVKRNKLKTKNGPVVFWILLNVFTTIFFVLFLLNIAWIFPKK